MLSQQIKIWFFVRTIPMKKLRQNFSSSFDFKTIRCTSTQTFSTFQTKSTCSFLLKQEFLLFNCHFIRHRSHLSSTQNEANRKTSVQHFTLRHQADNSFLRLTSHLRNATHKQIFNVLSKSSIFFENDLFKCETSIRFENLHNSIE